MPLNFLSLSFTMENKNLNVAREEVQVESDDIIEQGLMQSIERYFFQSHDIVDEFKAGVLNLNKSAGD